MSSSRGLFSPPLLPRGPLVVKPVSGNSVKLSWQSPLEDGGSAITRYIIDVIVLRQPDVLKRKIFVNAWITEHTVGELPINELCMFRVSAENIAGIGEALSLQTPIRICTRKRRPSPPGKPEVIPDSLLGIDPKKGADVVNLKWTPPRDNGGSHITGYLVERREMAQGGLGPGIWVRANAVLARAPRLAVASLEPGRRYQFRVRAENAAGMVSDPSLPSEPLAIGYQGGVATPPRFLTNLTDKLAVEEKRVDFVVDISGTPAPSICWYKDNNEIFSTRRTRVATGHGRSSLTFHQVGLADEGEIRCTATNKAGHAVTKALLKVEAPPHLRLPRSLHKEISGSPGSSIGDDELLFHLDEVIRLRVGISGRPQPEISWYHNEEKLIPGGRVEIFDSSKHSTLRIPAACRSDRGEYKAKAVNSHGEDSVSFLITVTDRPTPPSKVEAKLVQIGEAEVKTSEKEDETDEEIKPTVKYYLQLSWSPPEDDGGCKIGSYIIEYYRIGWNVWLKGATCRQLTLSLDNLVAGSEYCFRVKAENPYGVSEPSQESEKIFLPDPKRGLMAPQEQGSDSVDSEWLMQEERVHKEMEKRVHEEEQRERLQRKRHDLEDREREEEEEHMLRRRRRLELSPSPAFSPIPSPEWDRNTSPRSDYHTYKEGPFLSEHEHQVAIPRTMEKEAHSSGAEGTEFMLVLVPPKGSEMQQEGGEYLDYQRSMEEEEEGGEPSMAPPISLSAPVISGDGEPLMPPLRNAVSSSELLHERAMARIYQEAADEEAAARRGSGGAISLRRGSTSSRRGSLRDKENWKEIGEKMKEEEKARHSSIRGETVEEKEEETEITEKQEEEMGEFEEGEEEDQFLEEEVYEEEMEDEEDEEEELRQIEERDKRRAEAIRRQELELAESELRQGGLAFGVGGRSGRMVTRQEEAPPVPPHREVPSPLRSPAEKWEKEFREVPESKFLPHADNHQQESEDVPYRKFRTTRAPVPALHISTLDDYDDNGKALDPTAVVIGYYGDIIKEVSSRVRKASPALYLSREELKAKAEEDFDPFEHGMLVGETEADKTEEEKEDEPEKQEVVEVETEVEKSVGVMEEEELPVMTETPPKEVEEEQEEVDGGREVVLRTPSPPRVLTPRELAVEKRVQLIIDSFTTACLLGVASWLLMVGYDRTAAALVGILAAKEAYKMIVRRFPFLRRS